MPQLTANGLEFHVQTLGDPGDPPVVLIHGLLTGSVASWYFGLAPALSPDHRVFLYDQRGHGRSERPPSGYTLAELAADLDELTVPLGPCALVGHSYGGVVALRHAIDHTPRVTGVVLVDSFVPGGGDGAAPVVADAGMTGRWTGDDRPAASDRAREAGRRSRRHRATADELLLEGTSVLEDVRRDSVLDPVALARLPMPVLCAVGSDSPFRGDVEALVELLPAGRRVEVLPGGHALHVDAPGELARAVREFLDGLEATGAPGAPLGPGAPGAPLGSSHRNGAEHG